MIGSETFEMYFHLTLTIATTKRKKTHLSIKVKPNKSQINKQRGKNENKEQQFVQKKQSISQLTLSSYCIHQMQMFNIAFVFTVSSYIIETMDYIYKPNRYIHNILLMYMIFYLQFCKFLYCIIITQHLKTFKLLYQHTVWYLVIFSLKTMY